MIFSKSVPIASNFEYILLESNLISNVANDKTETQLFMPCIKMERIEYVST